MAPRETVLFPESRDVSRQQDPKENKTNTLAALLYV